jgi:hypothetical protein
VPHLIADELTISGPGSGCTAGNRRAFDPAKFRIILFDQRNCGRSLPHASDPAAELTQMLAAARMRVDSRAPVFDLDPPLMLRRFEHKAERRLIRAWSRAAELRTRMGSLDY